MAFCLAIRDLSPSPQISIDTMRLAIDRDDPRLRSFTQDGYLDYYGVFSRDEIWDINEAWLDHERNEDFLRKGIQLKTFLEKEENKNTMFMIHIYEWESGYGE